MGLPFIKLQQHTLNHGGTKLLGIGGEGAGGTEEREGAGGTEGKRRDKGGIGERERHMRNGGNAAPWIHNIQGAFLKRVQALPTFQVWSIHT